MSRVKDVLRRATENPRARRVVENLTIPYAPLASGINLVIADYYGMVVGESFTDDEEAARHYFRGGWRLGVVPNPFIHAPGTRFHAGAALVLRNALAAVALNARSPFPFAASRYATDNRSVIELTRAARTSPESLSVRVGPVMMPWLTYVQNCVELTGAASVIVQHSLIDLELYASQVGGSRPIGPYAALDDYIANGELDGRLPNPFFEAEWYHVHERSLVRRGRPVNLFLDFVARGEKGQASPHFWGHAYEQRLEGAPASLMGHFLAYAPADVDTPSSADVLPVARAEAETTLRARVLEYHRQLGLLRAGGSIRTQHIQGIAKGSLGGSTCLVFVDARHLRSAEAAERLRELSRQRIAGMRVVLVEQDDIPRRPEIEALLDEEPAFDTVARRDVAETFGAIAKRFIDDVQPDGWVLWTPAQRWDETFLADAVGALGRSPQARAAAVVNDSLPQAWLRTDDALWVHTTDAVGVVFRGNGPAAVIPDTALDLGVGRRLQIELAATRAVCVVLEGDLVRRIHSADVDALDDRAGANAARAALLAPFDRDPEAGIAVAMPTYEDWRMTLTAVRQVLSTTGEDVVVLVVDNGSRRPVASILATAFAGEPRVSIRRMPVNTDFALGSNIAASEAAREVTVFLNNDTAVQPGWLEPLVEGLREAGNVAVQPLLLYGDRTVQSAGTIFVGGLSMPRHLLADVHQIDVGHSLNEYSFSALTAACLALRYEDVRAFRGFDPHYVNGMEDVDLCLKLRTRGSLRVRTDSRVVHYESRTPGRHTHHFDNRRRFARRWRAELVNELRDLAVLDGEEVRIEDIRWTMPAGSPLREPTIIYTRRPTATVRESVPRLRWAIKTSATGDISGDAWGDTYFADSLASAIRKLGQDVVIDRRTSHDRPSSSAWDDVTLTLRGLEAYLPQPGTINLLWVISHPDLVTRYELESGFHRLYAAGSLWAQRTSEHWGLKIETLLQATDATKFYPRSPAPERDGALFVGRTRGVARPIVLDTIAAGQAPRVYGDDGWEQFIDPRFIAGEGIANDDVPAAYASASVVLNDHWADMAANGFFSNRLFDAAATGARIISDEVPGMADIFGPQVQTYRTVSDLQRLFADRSVWPSDEELHAAATNVVAHHSFDARARTLLEAALEERKGRG